MFGFIVMRDLFLRVLQAVEGFEKTVRTLIEVGVVCKTEAFFFDTLHEFDLCEVYFVIFITMATKKSCGHVLSLKGLVEK